MTSFPRFLVALPLASFPPLLPWVAYLSFVQTVSERKRREDRKREDCNTRSIAPTVSDDIYIAVDGTLWYGWSLFLKYQVLNCTEECLIPKELLPSEYLPIDDP